MKDYSYSQFSDTSFILCLFLKKTKKLLLLNQKMAPAADIEDEIKDEKNPPPLDEDDIALLKTYVLIYNPNFFAFLIFSCFL